MFDRGEITVRGVLVFAAVVFIGMMIGNWIVGALNLGEDPLSQVFAFFIPTVVVYVIWKKWGEKAAEED